MRGDADVFCQWDPTLVRGINIYRKQRKLMDGSCKSEILEQESKDGTQHPKEGKGHK